MSDLLARQALRSLVNSFGQLDTQTLEWLRDSAAREIISRINNAQEELAKQLVGVKPFWIEIMGGYVKHVVVEVAKAPGIGLVRLKLGCSQTRDMSARFVQSERQCAQRRGKCGRCRARATRLGLVDCAACGRITSSLVDGECPDCRH